MFHICAARFKYDGESLKVFDFLGELNCRPEFPLLFCSLSGPVFTPAKWIAKCATTLSLIEVPNVQQRVSTGGRGGGG